MQKRIINDEFDFEIEQSDNVNTLSITIKNAGEYSLLGALIGVLNYIEKKETWFDTSRRGDLSFLVKFAKGIDIMSETNRLLDFLITSDYQFTVNQIKTI